MLSLIIQWTQPNFIKRAQIEKTAQFLTIPYSHFVELARWALDESGI